MEAVQCSCTSMAQCMRHAPLDVFTPSCLDMHGEYILTVITAPPGITSFLHTCTQTLSKYPLMCFPSTTTSCAHLDSDDDPDQPLTPPDPEPAVLDQPTESTKHKHNEHNDTRPNETVEEDRKIRNHPIITAFDQEQHDIANDHPTYMDEHQEYMKWHYKLNHTSQKVMTKLAHKGMLPRTITKILRSMDKQGRKGPMCNDCYSASATRTPWRTKPDKHKRSLGDRRSSLSPGEVVSVDQLESSTPGFIGQITGMLTKQRIVGSTIFVDQASDFSYVYHHMSLSSEETVKAKQSFEKFAKSHGVNIKHYHADNGRFKDKAFMKEIEEQGQSISFIGVGAHHQMGSPKRGLVICREEPQPCYYMHKEDGLML